MRDRLGVILGGVLMLTVAACGHSPASAVPHSGAGQAALTVAGDRITPEDALKRATDKAVAWHSDARLVGVAWGVAKFEVASVVEHLFHSPKAGKLFLVRTKVVSFWQDSHEITDERYTLPARLLDTLGTYHVDAQHALDAARTYLPADDQHPIALVVEAKPTRLLPALWGVQADKETVLVDAQNGKVLIHTNRALPPLPFSLP